MVAGGDLPGPRGEHLKNKMKGESKMTKSEFEGFRNDINSKLDALKKLLKSKLTYLQYSENL